MSISRICANTTAASRNADAPRDAHSRRSKSRRHNVRQALDDDSARDVAEDDDSSSEHEFNVRHTFTVDAEKLTQPKVTVSINNTPVSFIIDACASVNLISASTLAAITPRPTLSKSAIKLFA